MTRVAVLDDYQDVALKMADWNVLPPDTKVQVFRDHLSNPEAVAERLKDVAGYKVFYGHVVEDIQAFLQGKPVRVINAATAARRS
jgi:hypothetical protein